jgi:hypothetical protein
LSECPHGLFLQPDDTAQTLYERARRATLDRRLRPNQRLTNTLRSHGAAGVLIDPERLETVLAASEVSRKFNTSYVERHNGTIRHMDARCGRKTLRFSKCKANHERQPALTLGYYHLCRPHKTLTRRDGQPTTPFMAASLTDHVWTMGELLRFKVENPCS